MTYPFVNSKNNKVYEINNTPTLIFANDQNTCYIDCIILSNISENQCNVTIYNLTEIEVNVPYEFIIQKNIIIPAYGMIDVLQGTYLTVEIGDILFAYSDASFNVFNSWINYRELKQLP